MVFAVKELTAVQFFCCKSVETKIEGNRKKVNKSCKFNTPPINKLPVSKNG
jgi:hypothetical protein